MLTHSSILQYVHISIGPCIVNIILSPTDIVQQLCGFGMLLVSEDLSRMTVWTILYYTRYVSELSTRSLSYLCPYLPSVVLHYNRRSIWLSSSCERASFKCNKAQVCKYAHSFAHIHSLRMFNTTLFQTTVAFVSCDNHIFPLNIFIKKLKWKKWLAHDTDSGCIRQSPPYKPLL